MKIKKEFQYGEAGKKSFPKVKQKETFSSSSFRMPGRPVIGKTRQKENRGGYREKIKRNFSMERRERKVSPE
jgi:hypothetical protein